MVMEIEQKVAILTLLFWLMGSASATLQWLVLALVLYSIHRALKRIYGGAK